MDKPQPQAPGLEQLVLGAIMASPSVLEELQKELNLTPEVFYTSAHQTLFKEILECKSKIGSNDLWIVSQHLMDINKLEEVGGAKLLTNYVKYAPTNGEVIYHAKEIVQKYIARQTELILCKAQERCQSLDDIGDIIGDVKKDLTDLIPECKNDYENFKIDPLCELTEPPVYCSIGNSPSMTAGNFSLLNGKVKSGKTFLLGSIVASMLNNSRQLEILTGSLPEDKQNILYFDTEQSSFHAARTIKRICSLIDKPNPPNLLAYSLRPFTPAERLAFIEEKISKTPNLGAVAIDGIRDLLTMGINDEMEATSLSSKFLKWTSDFNIHLILLLHQNKTDLNARGHIGTEILNKAETTLTVTKDKSDIFIVSCEYSRDISFNDFGFTIEDGCIKGSNLPAEEKAQTKNPQYIEDQKHYQLSDSIFKNNTKLSYTELQDAIIYGFGNTFGRNVSRTFITHYLNKGWIIKLRDGHKTFYAYTRASF
jgi:hypothetical protein